MIFKGESHSKNRVFFSSAIKSSHWVELLTIVLLSEGHAILMKFITKEVKIQHREWSFWTVPWGPGQIFMASFNPTVYKMVQNCLFLWAYHFKPERASNPEDGNSIDNELSDQLENKFWCTCERCDCCQEQQESETKMEGTFCSTLCMQSVEEKIYF